MIFLGVCVVFPTIAGTVSHCVMEPLTSKMRAIVERAFPREVIDIDGDGERSPSEVSSTSQPTSSHSLSSLAPAHSAYPSTS